MKPEKLFFPLMVAAAIIAIYLLFRNPQPAATVQGPNTASSGLPTITPQTQQYQVNPPTLTPTPLIMLANPFANDPNSTATKPPAYLSFNFGPSHDLTKTPTVPASTGKTGCGCEAEQCGCGSINNQFPDGAGCSKLASSGKRLIRSGGNDPWQNVITNIQGADLNPEPFTPALNPVLPGTPEPPNVLPPSSPKPVSNKKALSGKVPPIQAVFTGGGQMGQWGHEAILQPPYGSY